MTSQVEKIVKTYKALAQIPAIAGAKLLANNRTVASVWTQRNLERGKNAKFTIGYQIDSNLKPVSKAIPIDVSSETLASISPSETLRAVLRDVENKDGKKQFLEVWRQHNLTRCVDLNALDLHGDVYADGEFASFEWSRDETKLMYVAEKKLKKSEPFYKRKAPKGDGDNNEVVVGQEYVYRQDWGEQLVGKKQSVIVQYDIESDAIKILEGVPEDVCVAQPIWAPDGSYVVGVGLRTHPRKLGLIYCANRISTLFRLDMEGNYFEINLNNKCVKSPRFTPDGKTIIWLQREAGGPHMSAMALCKTSVPFTETSAAEVVIDIIDTQIEISEGSTFYGIYNTGFPRRCWANDGRLILNTPQKCTVNTYVVDISTKTITELPYTSGSQLALDVKNDTILVNRRNYLMQDKLAVGKLPNPGEELSISWTEITESEVISGLENCIYNYMHLSQDTHDEVKDFTAIYVGPKTGAEHEYPLIVWPHGGPHSVFANNLSLEESLFLSLGYAVLFINYRGSLGAGKKNVDFLLGKVGTSDVSDCVYSTQQALAQFPWLDPNRLILVGGSHGGFLVTHLSGQYPDMFKAVVARNPVIDIAAMSVVSDIPDWCYVEAGSEYTQEGAPSEELLLAMRKASPIQHAHKVKAPTLLQIGSKDLRVPPSQGTEYYHRLKANGITVKMNLYDDNHPLGTVPNEMDNLINAMLWIEEHVIKSK